jgi:hypothetical protein
VLKWSLGIKQRIIIGLGLVHQRIKVKTIVTGFFIFLIGFVIGLKLINDPKIIIFQIRSITTK